MAIKPTSRMRPLSGVDENGIIWDGGRPVGFWGIDGDKRTSDRGKKILEKMILPDGVKKTED